MRYFRYFRYPKWRETKRRVKRDKLDDWRAPIFFFFPPFRSVKHRPLNSETEEAKSISRILSIVDENLAAKSAISSSIANIRRTYMKKHYRSDFEWISRDLCRRHRLFAFLFF